ncbi:MAG: zinc metalloprotease HtpX, partial [Methanosarcinales archaeon]|nr:zinc metalloprotease HtpX [Methanosarcinales archaeon]
MRKWKTDWGLQGRMLFTMFLLAAVYLLFLAFLSYQGAGMNVMILFIGGFMFIQYFMADKLVLMSMGAKIVSESEEPKLHEMVTRLCAMADLPKPKVAVV